MRNSVKWEAIMKKRNTRYFFMLTLSVLLIFFSDGCTKENKELTPQHPKGLYRGVNLGNALEAPDEGDWGVVLEEEYFELIGDKGFDFVRIPIRWSAHAEENPPYTINPEFFDRIDWVINQALSRNLSAIINIHHYNGIMENPSDHKSRFLSLWEQIAEHYSDYSKNLYFEILNEPHDNLTHTLWNQYLKEAILIIRETNPDRLIIVGPTDWNSLDELDLLSIPEEDTDIIVTFHYYEPFHFTHQGAEWVDGSEEWLGTEWKGTVLDKDAIRKDLDDAIMWAKNHNRTLLLGEFGSYNKADMDSRVRWTDFIAREAEKRDIAWAYWEFCAGFGIYDPDTEEWRDRLLQALIP